ncbi:response regulator transcription factor [Paenibacillus segetis]|uniref:Two-component system, response regulator YesN n=1 Tax=Paenibacillus segetis TaxID=1325360 RepID=A0ABQ1Y641_9BACL|nr:response regulator [Paenibacillus segetis]GGH13636.1 hypothetical protein GCM10008013_06830 [Paenibacillus segetis]
MKVLLIEDEPKVRRALRRLLTEIDSDIESILEAEDGNEGLKLIVEKRPDILLLDMIMPGMHGDELFERIRTMKLDIPVIVVSGHNDFALVRHALANDAIDYILKPFDKEDVEKAFHKAKGSLVKSQLNSQTEQLVLEMRNEHSRQQFHALIQNIYTGRITKQELELLPEFIQEEACSIHMVVIRNYVATVDDRFRKDVALLQYAIRKCINEYAEMKGLELLPGGSGQYDWCTWFAVRGHLDQRLDTDELTDMLEHVLRLSCFVLSLDEPRCLQEYCHAINELESDIMYIQLDSGLKVETTPTPELLRAADTFVSRTIHLIQHRLSFRIQADIEELFRTVAFHGQLSVMFLFQIWTNLNARAKPLVKRVPGGVKEMDRVEPFALCIALDVDKAMVLFTRVLEDYIVEADTGTDSISRKKDNRAFVVKEYIDFAFCEPLSLADLAKRFYVSKEYLAAQFKSQFGMTVMQYIHFLRLELSRQRLEEADEPVSSIAVAVGYDHFSYFDKRFKEKYGVTPSEYRNRYKKQITP